MQRFVLIVVLLFATGVAAAAAGPATTAVRLYSPFDGNRLVRGTIVDSRAAGNCWTGSIAEPGRADAWRCMVKDDIHDPCFDGHIGARHVAVCALPFSKHVMVINPTAPMTASLGNRNSGTGGDPFALQLVDGARCVMLTGGTDMLAGKRFNYDCGVGSKETVYGDPDRSKPLWTISVRVGNSATLKPEGVLTAWY